MPRVSKHGWSGSEGRISQKETTTTTPTGNQHPTPNKTRKVPHHDQGYKHKHKIIRIQRHPHIPSRNQAQQPFIESNNLLLVKEVSYLAMGVTELLAARSPLVLDAAGPKATRLVPCGPRARPPRWAAAGDAAAALVPSLEAIATYHLHHEHLNSGRSQEVGRRAC